MLSRLFPAQADNSFDGHRAALWLLGLFVALKLMMSLNSIFNTQSVAVGADGFRLESYGADGARAVLMLFALMALGQLVIALTALTVLVRYSGLVPFIYLMLIGEHAARRLVVQSYAVPRADSGPIGSYLHYELLALLTFGVALSLIRSKSANRS